MVVVVVVVVGGGGGGGGCVVVVGGGGGCVVLVVVRGLGRVVVRGATVVVGGGASVCTGGAGGAGGVSDVVSIHEGSGNGTRELRGAELSSTGCPTGSAHAAPRKTMATAATPTVRRGMLLNTETAPFLRHRVRASCGNAPRLRGRYQGSPERVSNGLITMACVGQENGARLTAVVYGHVQGVGFRWWTKCRAAELGLRGHARNLPDGRVEVLAEGPRSECEHLLDLLRSGSTPGRVDRVSQRWAEPIGQPVGFVER